RRRRPSTATIPTAAADIPAAAPGAGGAALLGIACTTPPLRLTPVAAFSTPLPGHVLTLPVSPNAEPLQLPYASCTAPAGTDASPISAPPNDRPSTAPPLTDTGRAVTSTFSTAAG